MLTTATIEIYHVLLYLQRDPVISIFKKANSKKREPKTNYAPVKMNLHPTSRYRWGKVLQCGENHIGTPLHGTNFVEKRQKCPTSLCSHITISQHALLTLAEDLKASLNWRLIAGTIKMNLSKATDCLQHDFLTKKLHGYDFSRNSLQTACSHLQSRL